MDRLHCLIGQGYNESMPARIRPATPADGPGIAYVRVTTWRAAYHGIIPQDYLDGLDVIAESARWTEGMATLDPRRCAFVAENAGPPGAGKAPVIAGYCIAGPNRDGDAGEPAGDGAAEGTQDHYSGELYAIYVLPEYQGSGLGRALFTAAAGWLAEHGHNGMMVYVLRDNTPSRRFYERMGGVAVREQLIEVGSAMLPEVGYGYRW